MLQIVEYGAERGSQVTQIVKGTLTNYCSNPVIYDDDILLYLV